jgi:pSer/pThr/pTyr-binding forkhead associated (FHA) protein
MFRDAWLRVEAGAGAGRQLILSRPVTTIGLAGRSDLGLAGDPDVEAFHARILRGGKDFILTDAGSHASTFVNDRPVAGPVALHSGDLIRVGRTSLLFLRRR